MKEKINKSEVKALFAKAYLSNCTQSEILLLEYLLGMTGSFHTKIIDAFFSADHWNSEKLVRTFPELEAINSYKSIPGYWQELKKKVGI